VKVCTTSRRWFFYCWSPQEARSAAGTRIADFSLRALPDTTKRMAFVVLKSPVMDGR